MNTQSIITLQTPVHVTDLRTSGVLITCEFKGSTLSIADKGAGEEVADNKGADREAVQLTKKLAAGMPELKALTAHRSAMHNELNRLTYDWAGSQRYLPAQNFDRFTKWWTDYEREFHRLVKNFLDAWPSVISNAAFRMGGLFKPDDYPSVETLKNKFSLRCIQAEVPAGDFRNVLFHEALGDAQASMQAHVDTVVGEMLAQQKAQLVDVMRSLSTTLRVETDSATGKEKRGRVHDTTLQKAIDLCDLFAGFNPAGSADLREARNMLADALDGVDIHVLRENTTKRAEVKEAVDEILGKFSF